MPKKILVIEDDAALQNSIREILKSGGYTVISALTGEDGVRLAAAEIPDLILLDLILPQKDGFEVLTKVRNTPETSKVPVIVLTNLDSSEEVERALSLGARTFLVKLQYTLDEILEKVKKTLGDT